MFCSGIQQALQPVQFLREAAVQPFSQGETDAEKSTRKLAGEAELMLLLFVRVEQGVQ